MTDEPRTEEEQAEAGGSVVVGSAEVGAAESSAEAGPSEEAPAQEPPKKLKQAVEMRNVGPCKKHVKVTIERSDIDELMDKKFSELRVDANVAGFRPGKAPRKIIERRFHKDVA